MNTKQRRAVTVGIGGVLVVAAIGVGFAIANSRTTARRRGNAAPPLANVASTTGSAGLLPATPLIVAVAPGSHRPVHSSVFRVDPSGNAAASGVTHYEIWRHDENTKGFPWQVVGNIPANVLTKGYVYTDPHEQPGHEYSFRVVAVSATSRSGYNQIQIVAQPSP